MSKDQQRILTSAKSISLKVGLATSFALFALFAMLPASWAQSGNVKSPAEKVQPVAREEKFSPADSELQMSGAELRDYMKGKYQIEEIGVGEAAADNQYRSKRRGINIRGDLTPQKAVVPKEGKFGLQRAAAEAFIAEEGGSLFGVKNNGDIREFTARGDSYGIIISYKRYVGDLPLEGAYIQIGAKEDGSLVNVTAYLVPVTDELLEAVKQPTLSEADIRKVILQDINQPGLQKKFDHKTKRYSQFPTGHVAIIQQSEKEAIPVPPYVVWKVETTVMDYTIDAFSGKVMKKLTNIIID